MLGKGISHGEEMASAVDFKRHIEALHYLLQLWPGNKGPEYLYHVPCKPDLMFTFLPQCRPIKSHQDTRQTILISWASSRGISTAPSCNWLCLRARRRWWCHAEGAVVWLGLRVLQSTGTLETGASVDEISSLVRKLTMMKWQEVRVMEVKKGPFVKSVFISRYKE